MPRAQSPTPPSPDGSLGRVLEFLRVLWAVDHGLQTMSKRMEAALGVTGPQRMTIRIIGRFPRIAAGDLAELLHLHPSTLSGIVRRLEKRGMVVKRSDPVDARRVRYELTAAGRQINGHRAGTVEASVARALAKVDDAKLEAAREVLEAIARGVSSSE